MEPVFSSQSFLVLEFSHTVSVALNPNKNFQKMQSVILEVMLCSRSLRDIWFFDQVQGQDGWILAKLFFAFL